MNSEQESFNDVSAGGDELGKKKIFYLDPDDRKWTMEDLGLSWETYAPEEAEQDSIDGLYLMKDGIIFNASELENRCHVCLEPLAYHDEFDAQYCTACDEWREDLCSDPACEYCFTRPKKPSDYKGEL